jgi:hypothetical protein
MDGKQSKGARDFSFNFLAIDFVRQVQNHVYLSSNPQLEAVPLLNWTHTAMRTQWPTSPIMFQYEDVNRKMIYCQHFSRG